jgi:hypothetical protein
MSRALAVAARLTLPALALCATLACLHPAPATLAPAPVDEPLVTMHRVPAPALPTVAHCWREPSGELLSGDPTLAVADSVPVPCP